MTDLKKKGLTELTDLNAFEVSLVDAGANKKKRFPVFKQEEFSMDEILKAVLETEIDEEGKLNDWFEKAKLSAEGQNAVKGALRLLSGYKDQIPGDVLSKLSELVGFPASEKKTKKSNEKEDEIPISEKKKAECKPEEEEMRKVKKELSPELEEIFKAQEIQLAAMKSANEEITKALKVEKDKRETAEWIDKASRELSHFPGKSAKDLGVMLKALNDSSPERAQEQFALLKSASDAMKTSSIFKEAGIGGAADSQNGSAWEKIEKMASGLVEKSADKSFTVAKAIDLVIQRNPALYQEYLNEHPRQTGSAGN